MLRLGHSLQLRERWLEGCPPPIPRLLPVEAHGVVLLDAAHKGGLRHVDGARVAVGFGLRFGLAFLSLCCLRALRTLLGLLHGSLALSVDVRRDVLGSPDEGLHGPPARLEGEAEVEAWHENRHLGAAILQSHDEDDLAGLVPHVLRLRRHPGNHPGLEELDVEEVARTLLLLLSS